MSNYSQGGRIIAIDTPLGENVLLLQKLTGADGISSPFHFELELLSENPSISFHDIVGQRVTITMHLPNGQARYINGFVSRYFQSGRDNRFSHYRAEVVPWLWLLTRNADCRIFQQKTPLEIIKQVFTDRGFAGDFMDKTQGSYETREYCVQYRETDFNFVSRLMEEYGIFYYFEHAAGKHTLILGDAPSAHQACPFQETAVFDSTARVLEEERITAFEIGEELQTGACSLNDYNFETPLTDLDVSEPTIVNLSRRGSWEFFDYPGIYLKKSLGEHVAKVRMQEQEAKHLVGHGASTCGGFSSGYKFKLLEHYREDLNQTYLLMEVEHTANCGTAYYTGELDEDDTYENRFTVIPVSVPYRPSRRTPRQVVRGPQTAVVVGPGGEEIYVDKYGRVKVHFFWDRAGKPDENASCWIRVSQLWAGKLWGAVWTPRIGQEVVVDFLEGDPDRPLITGRVYNADQMPPYTLPDEKTKSTIKSYSSKGGGGFNELRFEDKKDSEEIFVHAQKDLNTVVLNNETRQVGIDRTSVIHSGNETLTVEKGNRSVEVSKANDELMVKLGDITVKAPVGTYHLEAKIVEVQATATIKLTCGASTIEMTPGTITFTSPMIKLNC